jgi:hypothetical protein
MSPCCNPKAARLVEEPPLVRPPTRVCFRQGSASMHICEAEDMQMIGLLSALPYAGSQLTFFHGLCLRLRRLAAEVDRPRHS